MPKEGEKTKAWLIKNCPNSMFPYVYSIFHPGKFKAEKIWLLKKDGVLLLSPTSKFVSFGLKSFQDKFERYFAIEPDDVAVDVGACIGDTTVPMAMKAKQVIAVEPDQRNLLFLWLNTQYLGNVKIIPKAASNSTGKTSFFLHSSTTGHSLIPHKERRTTVTVPCDTLDNMFQNQKIDFAKIDVQGAEAQVLEGGDNFLKTVSKLIVETHGRYTKEKTYPEVMAILDKYTWKDKWFCMDNGLVYAWR